MNQSGPPKSEAETNLEIAILAHGFAKQLMPHIPAAVRRTGTARNLLEEHTTEELAAMLATLIDIVAMAGKA